MFFMPQQIPLDNMPSRVTICEVGPRDGLQNEKTAVSVDVKLEFIERLAAAGHRLIEVTSFVRPAWVPQLADAEELLDRLPRVSGVRYPVLIPNARGLERAMDRGITDIAIFGSATETFAQRNLNRSVAESLLMFEPVVAGAKDAGGRVRAYLSMCFGDPWEGAVPIMQVVAVAKRMMDLGCDELSLGDTIGVATPGHVTALIDQLVDAGVCVDRIGVHFHDTYGQALANTLAAMSHGVTLVDASAGGLGGCPFANSATGNLATEDLLWQLHGLDIDTGVDLLKIAETSIWMAAQLGRPSPSRVVQAIQASISVAGTTPSPTST